MKLNLGEIICDQCNGSGYNMRPNHYKCPKCHGAGKLDWIEVIVGKKTKSDIFNGVNWMAPNGTAPINPSCGQAYINTNNDKTYVYDGNTWVEVVCMNTPM